jgi:putative membrane protein
MPNLAGLHVANEMRRFKRSRLARLAVIAMIFIPLLYSALYLWAFWNPLDKTEDLPVALVNSDRGAELQGQKLNAGDEVVDGLRDNDRINWTEVSHQEAEEGVRDGRYYFSLELPENFSEAVSSAAGQNAEKARLIATYNDANSYLSTVIGQNVMREVLNTVGTKISGQAVDKVLIGVLDAGSGLGEAAEGSGTLSDGINQLSDKIPTLTGGINQLKDGAGTLDSGLGQLKDGSSTLAGGTQELHDQVGQLNQLIDQSPRLASGIDQLGDGATQLRDGIGQLTGQLGAVTDMQGSGASSLRGVADDLRALNLPAATDAANRIDATAASLETEGLGPQSQNAQDMNRLNDGAAQLAHQLADPDAEFRGGIDQLTGSTGQLTRLIDGVSQLNDGAHQLDANLATAKDGAHRLNDGLGQAAGQLPQLTDGVGQLKDGANELHQRLADGAKQAPTWNDGQRVQAASTIGGPVSLDQGDDAQGSSFGKGLAPFFFSLALFIGGIVVFQILKPLQQRAVAAGVGAVRAAIDGFVPPALMAAGQAVVMVAVSVLAVGLDVANLPGYTAVAILVALAFMAVNQALNALLGPGPGRVTSLALLMVTAVSSGGIYPVETQNPLIQAIHPFNPMTYAVNALRQTLYGFHDARLWTGIAVLVATIVVSLAVTAFSARTQRTWSMKRLHPVLPV